jgi:hypothetical protein
MRKNSVKVVCSNQVQLISIHLSIKETESYRVRHKFCDTLEKHQNSCHMINSSNLFHICKLFALFHISYRSNIKKYTWHWNWMWVLPQFSKIIKMTEIFNCFKWRVFSKMKIVLFLSFNPSCEQCQVSKHLLYNIV